MTIDMPGPDTERSSSMPSTVLTDLLDLLGEEGLHLLGRGAGQRSCAR